MLPQDARKQDLNKRLETVSWGLFLIMLGGFALVKDVPEGTWLIGAGLIMLGLNAVRLLSAFGPAGSRSSSARSRCSPGSAASSASTSRSGRC